MEVVHVPADLAQRPQDSLEAAVPLLVLCWTQRALSDRPAQLHRWWRRL